MFFVWTWGFWLRECAVSCLVKDSRGALYSFHELLCTSLFSPVACPTNLNYPFSANTLISCSLAHCVCFPLPPLYCSLESASRQKAWGNYGAHFICFHSLRDYSPAYYQISTSIYFIYFAHFSSCLHQEGYSSSNYYVIASSVSSKYF